MSGERMQPHPVEVHSVLFRPDNSVEVTWAESDEVTPEVSLVRTIVISRQEFASACDDVEDFTRDLIEDALVRLRNPADRKPSRRDR